MTELELSIMAGDLDATDTLRLLLKEFEATRGVRIRLTVLSWLTGWMESVKSALYGHGPDVSEIGSTWMSGLVGMNALLPLTERDVRAVGGPSAFLSPAWQSGSLVGEKRMWAIPWLAGTRVIFYRRDLLEKAGVDERTAFQTFRRLEQTLGQLQASGCAAPWVVPTCYRLDTLHYVASWIWGAGGDFLAAYGQRVLFNEKEAIAGMRDYFGLVTYLPQTSQELDASLSDNLFWQQGRVAVTIGGDWILRVQEKLAASEVIANLGVAVAPGVPFVGGSNLVAWRHTRHENAAVELIRFLTSQQAQIAYSQRVGLLPTRLDALAAPHLANNSWRQVMSQGLKTGRSFPSTPLWSLVEDKLPAALARIWADVLAAPHSDLGDIITGHLDPLAQRLNFTLSSAHI
jgi:multiple sugar transport system substrate-binding protein